MILPVPPNPSPLVPAVVSVLYPSLVHPLIVAGAFSVTLVIVDVEYGL